MYESQNKSCYNDSRKGCMFLILISFHFQIKEAMFLANKEHKDTLTRMEQKFFEEKVINIAFVLNYMLCRYCLACLARARR